MKYDLIRTTSSIFVLVFSFLLVNTAYMRAPVFTLDGNLRKWILISFLSLNLNRTLPWHWRSWESARWKTACLMEKLLDNEDFSCNLKWFVIPFKFVHLREGFHLYLFTWRSITRHRSLYLNNTFLRWKFQVFLTYLNLAD